MKKDTSIQYKCIYNLRLAGYLMMNGFPIKRIETNLGRPWRNVYLFRQNEKIEKFILKYKSEKSKENNDGTYTSTNSYCKNDSSNKKLL